METVQIVIDKDLLRAADQAARRTKRNRSALIRDALREHLRRLRVREAEERDRAGYGRGLKGRRSLSPGRRRPCGRQNSAWRSPAISVRSAG